MGPKSLLDVDGLIFDIGGTLTRVPNEFDTSQPWRAYLSNLVSGNSIEDQLQKIKIAENVTFQECFTKHKSYTFCDVLRMAGVQFDQDCAQAYRDAWKPWTVVSCADAAYLRKLKNRGHRLGLISNTIWPADWHREFLRRDAILDLFDAMIFSSEFSCTKPDPRIFLECMGMLGGEKPRRFAFIGDRLKEDVGGSKKAGMKSILLDRYKSHLNLDHTSPLTPDYVIDSLTGLDDILMCDGNLTLQSNGDRRKR